jgi:RHS repeat-associated protein
VIEKTLPESSNIYHPDHLGSAQLVTDHEGKEYERIEYTPYGESWIEKAADGVEMLPFRFTGKELDAETGLYYYGARYLNPKTSVWISADPALGEYLPEAPVDDEAKKHNGNLSGQGGVFNLVNLAVYHYAANNPVKYVDPDGKIDKNYLNKGIAQAAEGAAQVLAGQALKNAAVPIVLTNPAALGAIDNADQIISEGQDKVDEGKATIKKAYIADAIGKGHAYTEHANKQGKGEFKSDGISGSGTPEDKEKFVSLITSIITDGKAEHKGGLENGREAYWDNKTVRL